MFRVLLCKTLVEMRRIELLTPCLQGRCSPSWATPPNFVQLCVKLSSAYTMYCLRRLALIWTKLPQIIRFAVHFGFFRATPCISLTYRTPCDRRFPSAASLPTFFALQKIVRSGLLRNMFRILLCKMLVGLSGLEPPTSRLSGVRSNRLSYRPIRVVLSGSKFLSYPTSSQYFFVQGTFFAVSAYTLKDKQCKSVQAPVTFVTVRP